jgi:shikimate dehydrogenase
MREVSGATTVLGVFGHPIGHSLSPLMHARFAEATGADTIYVPFPVPPEGLATALNALPALGIRGVNVTVPHKEAVRRQLGHLEPAAKAIGAVNTVINHDGVLVGDNTDARGFLADLEAQFPDGRWKQRPALVLGAGGAARAVAFALGGAGLPAVTIANRTAARAESLAAELLPRIGHGTDLAPERLSDPVAAAGLIVNTTSVGLEGEAIPGLDLGRADPGACVYDLIYNPPVTPLLHEARQRGLAASNGLGMLVRQGAISYALWTGKAPPVEPVIDALAPAFGS